MKPVIENLTQYIKVHQYESIFGLCALFLAYVAAVSIKKARSNFPPGPIGLPIVGYLPFLTKNMYLDFMELGKKYGDVFSVRLGSLDVVILHGADAITEAFSKDEFLSRPLHSALDQVRPSSAFFSSHFLLWKEQRKFVMQSMNQLGLGKTKAQETVMEEINHFKRILRSYKTQPIDIKESLTSSTSNIICTLVFGKRFEYDDPEYRFINQNVEEIFIHFSQTQLDILFPWIHYIPFAAKYMEPRKIWIAVENLEKVIQKEINQHIKTFDPAHLRDFIDLYLVEIESQRTKNPETSFSHKMLINHIIDLLLAGNHTLQVSVNWFIYIAAAYPCVQKKVQKEIMEVIGSERTPEYMDMKNMPFTHAVIMETLRWKTTLPLSLAHSNLWDTKVSGYTLPKGQAVIANLWSIHHDPRYWDEPEKFRPQRFLDKDGKSVVKPKCYMPFFRGKRVCPGESMAYLEVFLYFTSILQEFDLSFPEGTEPNFAAKYFVNYEVEPYMVRFISKS